jgi:hypothetical protein
MANTMADSSHSTVHSNLTRIADCNTLEVRATRRISSKPA